MVACVAVDVGRFSQHFAGGYRQRDRRYLFFVQFFLYLCVYTGLFAEGLCPKMSIMRPFRINTIEVIFGIRQKNIRYFLSANRKGFICFDQIHVARQISSRQRRIVSSLLELPSDTQIGRIYTIFIRFFLHYFICLQCISNTARDCSFARAENLERALFVSLKRSKYFHTRVLHLAHIRRFIYSFRSVISSKGKNNTIEGGTNDRL